MHFFPSAREIQMPRDGEKDFEITTVHADTRHRIIGLDYHNDINNSFP
jgi:hypothetical protein